MCALILGGAMMLIPQLSQAAEQSTKALGIIPEVLVVNLNTATAEQLMKLPGVGKKKAEDFIRARKIRPYRRVSDIMRIRGIGRKTYQRLKPYLRVREPRVQLATDMASGN